MYSSAYCSTLIAKGVRQWAAEPGPLTLVGIDTGHGHLHVDSLGITHASFPEVTINPLWPLTLGNEFAWSYVTTKNFRQYQVHPQTHMPSEVIEKVLGSGPVSVVIPMIG